MRKEGLSHIEVILGFVIFMISIFFLLASYQPLFKEKHDDSQLIQKLYSGFLENTSIEVREYYVFVKNPLPVMMTIDLGEDLTGYSIFAFDKTGNAYSVGNTVLDQGTFCLNGLTAANNFVIIRAIKKEAIASLSYGCSPAVETDYQVSTKLTENLVFTENLNKFNESYYFNKMILKKKLDIPTSADFEFNLSLSGKDYIGKEKRDISKENVYSTKRKVKAINGTGSIVNIDGLFRIW